MTISCKNHQKKEQEEERDVGKIERKLFEVNTKVVSREQNELIDKLKSILTIVSVL